MADDDKDNEKTEIHPTPDSGTETTTASGGDIETTENVTEETTTGVEANEI